MRSPVRVRCRRAPFGCQVVDDPRVFEHGPHEVGIAHVALNEMKAVITLVPPQIVHATAAKVVEHDDLGTAVAQKAIDEMTTYESRPTRDDGLSCNTTHERSI